MAVRRTSDRLIKNRGGTCGASLEGGDEAGETTGEWGGDAWGRTVSGGIDHLDQDRERKVGRYHRRHGVADLPESIV
jgi:hypothetical protein